MIYGATAMGIGVFSGSLLSLIQDTNFFLSYLISINATSFVIYGYDKAIAGSTILRVPELVFHILAVFGGSPGALVGQLLFRHKIRKRSFHKLFWLIILAQTVSTIFFYGLKSQ